MESVVSDINEVKDSYLTPRNGKGRELCDLLRSELKIPEGVVSFEVKFAVNEIVTVSCVYMPKG